METEAPQAPPHAALGHPPGAALWVFAYGSLMWRPGFPVAERHPALVHGWHRSFCLYSWRHRGTPERPGAVLGLDRGGACRGIAYRVPDEATEETLAYLWDREMVNYVYRPRRLTARLAGGRTETALAFVVDPRSRQYCGRLPPDALAALIRQGEGQSGRALDYFLDLLAHLRALGIRDHGLEALRTVVAPPGGGR